MAWTGCALMRCQEQANAAQKAFHARMRRTGCALCPKMRLVGHDAFVVDRKALTFFGAAMCVHFFRPVPFPSFKPHCGIHTALVSSKYP